MSDENREIIDSVDWDETGLVPAIAQDVGGQVLTLAYMDSEALEQTLSTGFAHYFSRSKGRIRKKGEVSGNVQVVEDVKLDCDGDALLVRVNQQGPACHTGKNSCFYRSIGEPEVEEGGIDYSLNVLKELEEVIRDRRENPRQDSYTSELFARGIEEINKKLGEEAIEAIVAAEDDNFVDEAADLVYHLLVLLRERGIELGDVMNELGRRRK
ncbi:MAG: bifunctional phosphoribosyl-AMP cyclohydrolase/phosphoribosyl-ATP diphosphatase HisIE [Candidatus Bipolaricaulota bacterium]|nr:bifunctional phosphoribosyl-AMP cyclohydrolase/phosphoribosyl-ATP diphosphatase HisIE [Candidatus Bipolaricaulota bacterium]MBS3791395.1 bifunctional phosphoribosyl-AMP cyclohydrolase/phosphoribosyl-ATP diphosphatase HisIE [Candidatus Bipolaricaulota bacterium]